MTSQSETTTMEELPSEVRASYIVIIDDILAKSDLQTITSRKIRDGLQDAVDYDITPQKVAIKKIIMDRFDKFIAESKEPATNGHTEVPVPAPTKAIPEPTEPVNHTTQKVGHKRKANGNNVEDDSSMDMSDIASTPPKKRKSVIDDDAAFAARLQAEENGRARSTRGGNVRKTPAVKRKKKTAARVSANDDSDISGSENGSKRKVNRNTGFHKPLVLSEALSALLDGEEKLSRPQTVKRIWAYVKERELQDPKDKRQIRCDEALRAVFKADRVHMFTLNKLLSTQLYDPDV